MGKLTLSQEAKKLLETQLNSEDVFAYVAENRVLPHPQCMELEALIPELNQYELYDALVNITHDNFLVRFICTSDNDIESVEIPKTTSITSVELFTDETMVKFSFDMAWKAVKTFEIGVPLYTREGAHRFTRLTTTQDVLRYLYRLYISKEDIAKTESACFS